MSTKTTTETSVIVDEILAKFEEKLTGLVEGGHIVAGTTLTQFDLRMEHANGDAEWVAEDGQVFVTKTNQPGFDRVYAPVIPSACKKLAKGETDAKTLEAARKQIKAIRLGFYGLRESRLATAKPPRTLPGTPGKKYHSNVEIAEMQKYGDAGDKIGL